MQINRCINCENEINGYPCPYCGFDGNRYQQPGYALPCEHILHGRYLIGRVMGQGGFGMTYVGWDLVLQYKCAIKEYYPNGQAIRDCTFGLNLRWSEGAQAEELRRTGLDSFLREARKMNRVDHIPEVVRVRDTFIENDTAYIVMDYVEGRTLKARLEAQGVLSWEEGRKIFLPVVAAMEKVHAAGLVHRDLSPDNIMLEPRGGVKILDLGAAKDLSVNSGASSMQVAKGGFSPIEQYTQRGGSGPWSDVYALAATMYYSFTGKLPPTAIDRLEEDTIRWDLPQLKALPRVVQDALKKAMVVSAQKRTQSMALLLKQLEAAPKPKLPKVKQEKPPKPPKEPKPPKPKKEKPPKPPKEPKPPKPPKPKKEKEERKANPKSVRLIAAVLAVVLLGGAGFALLPERDEVQMEVPHTTTAPEATTVPTEPTTEPTEPPHVHTWSLATVGSPARCSACGLMTGTALPRTIAAGNMNGDVYGVKADGTVEMACSFTFGVPEEVKKWSEIGSLCKGYYDIFGIRNDGTVAFVNYSDRILPIEGWTDITFVSDSLFHVAGLRQDGTVITVPAQLDENNSWWSERKEKVEGDSYLRTESWTDIVALAAGTVGEYKIDRSSTYEMPYTIGLKADGTLLIAAEADLFPEAKSWTDIVSFAVMDRNLLGLKADGTVVAVWDDDIERSGVSAETRAQVEAWTDIVQIDCGITNWTDDDGTWHSESTVAGLKADGTAVLAADWSSYFRTTVAGWKDMVSISVNHSGDTVLGLRSGGTTATITQDYNHKITVYDYRWSGIRVPKAEPISQPEPVPQPEHVPEPEADHVHTWTEATVGSPARCEVCGLMTGTVLGNTVSLGACVRGDGTVAFEALDGIPGYMAEDVAKWEDVVSVYSHVYVSTYGIKSDGTVYTSRGYNPASTWTDIVKLAIGPCHIVGLRRDGTVVAAAQNSHTFELETPLPECLATSEWRDIVDIAASRAERGGCTIGLKTDGTLVFAGNANPYPQARQWKNLVSISASDHGLVGLKADGTVVSEWYSDTDKTVSRLGLDKWTDIVQVLHMGRWNPVTVGLKADGTLVSDQLRPDLSGLTDIVAIGGNSFLGDYYQYGMTYGDISLYALKSDGSVVKVQLGGNVTDPLWTDMKLPG